MGECSHVLCRWEGRLWPAKVLPKPDRNFRRRKDMEVEILGEEKRVRIAEKETWPLTRDGIDALCHQLGQSVARPMDELRYRKALRLALNVFSAESSPSPSPGGSPRRSYRLNPASIMTLCPVLPPRPPGSPKTAAQTVTKARSTPAGQQGAAVSSSKAGESTGRKQPLRLQGGARAGNRHASPSPSRVKSGRRSHGNRKQRKGKDPHQSPPSRDGQRSGVSVEESHSDLGGCDTAEATPAATATPTATPSSRWTSPVRGRSSRLASSSCDAAADTGAALPSPVNGGSDPGLSTPKRPRSRPLQKRWLSSTPRDCDRPCPSGSPESAPAEELTEQRVESEMKLRQRKSRNQVGGARQGRGQLKERRAQRKGGSSDTPPAAKRRKGVRVEAELTATSPAQSCGSDVQPPARHRARFEPAEESEGPGETSLSSDLSIKFSFLEDSTPLDSSFLQEEVEEEDEGEDEELPSFLLQMEKKPLSITEGICVWCKLRNYPFWPAMVKSVNRKRRKASVVFIDNLLLDQKRSHKGICVSLRTLKPFDCEEMDELVDKAREKYDTAISWCLNLIRDYQIRIGSGFTGSFMEYFADDMSCTVRRTGGGEVTFPTKLDEEEEEEEEVATGEQGVASSPEGEQRHCKLMPDREKAARDRANQKLVDFITQKRDPEEHLLAVISGRESSKWLRAFLTESQSVMVVYLEDYPQVDQVFCYLLQVYRTAPCVAPCLAQVDEVRFITDVLLPEAIIHAIAAVEKLSLKQAENRYLQGACKSERERAEFNLMIEQQMKEEAKNQRHREREELS
ncbi:hypothetical protein ANANG_G00131980 [Anguilla anguilla]|uniref:PWWP domain-containing protein n=1 Tax=Anguilla anguilla TaxID=7936 RepID=A0A9D3S0G0_ANGAN|nr:hypothetical protein ANANG_G00131980 [Anguilla anguilla]